MISLIFNKIKRINKIKFRFDLPKQAKILQYDELNSDFIKNLIKRDFNIMPRHKPEIYFWILFKQVIFFDFKFSTYFKNYLKYTSTKIVINLIDNDLSFYTLKENLKNIHFISIQNGIRPPTSPMFNIKNIRNYKILKCDHFFLFNKYLVNEYKRIIKSKYHVVGSLKNNSVKINKTQYKKSYLFISRQKISPKLLDLISHYFSKNKKKINILLKSKKPIDQKKEIKFYKNFFKIGCIFHKSSSWKESYRIIDKFENIIFTNSTLGYEAISRKKKVAIFALKKDKSYREYFGWPAKIKKKYNFFLAQDMNYSEIKRVLENIYNCEQKKWENLYYKDIKKFMYFDKDNSQIKKLINNILKSS